jgi:hypothetical protein
MAAVGQKLPFDCPNPMSVENMSDMTSFFDFVPQTNFWRSCTGVQSRHERLQQARLVYHLFEKAPKPVRDCLIDRIGSSLMEGVCDVRSRFEKHF